ncbi:terminase large subunit domain-containing protein [Salinilacihabitans rarus]|uniref:terminase large subunit domain-containing protein n=1 Tax=Salinilacihabitans rarus TaxID=2961596 RepID=UPI0020C90288|nr:terminase family protein [Salinilacihabitans rarus]
MATSSLTVDFDWADYQFDVVEELEEGDSDVVVLRTGYGGGKSYTGAQWIHLGSMQLSSGESLVLAPDFQKGGPATYRVFFETLPGENTIPNDAGGDPENSPIVAGYNQNQKRVTYVSGHVVRLGSADKWNRYAGSEFHRIWMDEPSHYDNTDLYDLHEMLISRQRTQAGPNTCLMTSTGNGFNQFYDITERQVDANGEPLPWADSMEVFVHSSLQNPFLPADAKEKLRRQFEGTEREEQALHGGFAAAEGLVYSSFTREHHVVPEAGVNDLVNWNAPAIYGYDSGWDHPRVFIEWRQTHCDQWIAVDCYYESEKPFEHLCDPRNESGWVYDRNCDRSVVYCEHEPEHILKFRQAGFRAMKAEKSLDEGIPFVRGLLERKGDPPRPGLLVSDRCVELIQEFQSYKEEHVGKSGDVPDHALDASRYALFSHTPTTSDSDSSGVSYL